MFSALLGIEGLLIGVFLQEGRVQEKTQQVAEAQHVVATYSTQVNRLEHLTSRLSSHVSTPEARVTLDSIRAVIDSTKRMQPILMRPLVPIRRPPRD